MLQLQLGALFYLPVLPFARSHTICATSISGVREVTYATTRSNVLYSSSYAYHLVDFCWKKNKFPLKTQTNIFSEGHDRHVNITVTT